MRTAQGVLPMLLGLLATATAAAAAPLRYVGSLSGPAEAPPNASPGTGSALVIVDTVAHTMVVDASFSGLTGVTTAAHIHCCTTVAGVATAGVATTTPTFPGFPSGVSSGTYQNTLDMANSASYNPSFLSVNGGSTASAEAVLAAGVAAGKAYFNIHSSTFGGGEIRAFLVADTIFFDGFE